MSEYELQHWGIKGMKWGIRRFQNKDGSLTAQGRKRYADGSGSDDLYGLDKKDFDPDAHELKRKFTDEKIKIANKYVDEDFSGENVKKQIDYESDVNEAYVRYYYSRRGLDDVDALFDRYNRLAYDSPEAKKVEASRNRFMYDEASSRLKAALDESKKDGFVNTYYIEKHKAYQEYECLWYAYQSAYMAKITDKMDLRRELLDKLERESEDWYAEHSGILPKEMEKMSIDELYHHGIKGMKWGVRRFQDKFGRLTALGKKRYADDDDGSSDGSSKSSKPKSVKSMTDQELRDRVNRLSLERQALDLERQVSSLSPQKVTLGQKFANSTLGRIVTPAITESGKRLLTDYLNKTGAQMLGLKEDDMGALKKEVEKLRLTKEKKEISDFLTRGDVDPDKELEKEAKRWQWRSNIQTYKDKLGYGSDQPKSEPEPTNPKPAESKPAQSVPPKPKQETPKKTFTPSNSNSQSVHSIYKSMFPAGYSSMQKLYNSGYTMTSLSKLEDSQSHRRNMSNGKAYVSSLTDYKMRSLDDIYKYN